MNKRYLVFEDGDIFYGVGYDKQVTFPDRAGEIVFNTSHSGYEEIATDPSYLRQIVVMTAPMQGNYGVDRKHWESKKYWINGFVCLQLQQTSRNSSWAQSLMDQNIPMLTEVDTRRLTLKLRDQGTPWGALVEAFDEHEARAKAKKLIQDMKQSESDWVWLASRKEVEDRQGQNNQGPKIAVLDFGAKENILRELQLRTSQIRLFSSRTDVNDILNWNPDGIMLTNGPGDPDKVQVARDTVKSLVGKLPIFGICMGHQILSLALGAQTYKLKFGHRGANHPIEDLLINKIYISSQNHGYAVDAHSFPASIREDIRLTHKNLNDQTVAGFFSEKLKVLGIQYHPESHPGPHDAVLLFDFFIHKMILNNKAKNDYTATI